MVIVSDCNCGICAGVSSGMIILWRLDGGCSVSMGSQIEISKSACKSTEIGLIIFGMKSISFSKSCFTSRNNLSFSIYLLDL